MNESKPMMEAEGDLIRRVDVSFDPEFHVV
jgi:hypothetical protein